MKIQNINTNLSYRSNIITINSINKPHEYLDINTICETFYKTFTKNPENIKKNFYHFGALLKKNENNINDNNILEIQKLINKIQTFGEKSNKKNYTRQTIGMIYSTTIKLITENILENKEISANLFRQFINESINYLYQYPADEINVDYRHILGKLSYLKNLNKNIMNNYGNVPFHLTPIKWTLDDQLKYIEVMEIIKNNFDENTNNFRKPIFKYEDIYPSKFDKDTCINAINIANLELLHIVRNKTNSFINYLSQNKIIPNLKQKLEDMLIEIEIAKDSFDKIDFNFKNIQSAWQDITSIKKDEERILALASKKNK